MAKTKEACESRNDPIKLLCIDVMLNGDASRKSEF